MTVTIAISILLDAMTLHQPKRDHVLKTLFPTMYVCIIKSLDYTCTILTLDFNHNQDNDFDNQNQDDDDMTIKI